MNLIFIIIDAMRWDYMSINGYPRNTTPNLDRFSDNAVIFDRAFATINQTDQSLTSIFTGTYPITHGLEKLSAFMQNQDLLSLPAWYITYLPEVLKEKNYETYGIDWLHNWHQRGYDWYFGRDSTSSSTRLRRFGKKFPGLSKLVVPILQLFKGKWSATGTKPGSNAKVITDKALNILNKHKADDLFLMIHYWDAHLPYIGSSQYLEDMKKYNLPGEDQDIREVLKNTCKSDEYKEWARKLVIRDATSTGELISHYCAELRNIDEQIGRIINYVDEMGIADQTIIVVTADHGENFFEHGYFIEHSGIYDNVMHVPLLVSFPHCTPTHVTDIVSHVDLMPTLLNYLEIPLKDFSFDGINLMPLIHGQSNCERNNVYLQSRIEESRWGLVNGEYKFIEDRNHQRICEYCGCLHHPHTELYAFGSDHSIKNNLADREVGIVNMMKEDLEKILENIRRFDQNKSLQPELSYDESEKNELEQRLRDLGYID